MKPPVISVRLFLWAVAILVVVNASVFAGSEKACSNATLQGHYAFTETGNILEIGPVAVAGVFQADGKGNLIAVDTVSLNGTIQREHLTFSYQVNADCTGTASSAPGEEPAHFNFIIIGNGREVLGIHTDPGTTLLLTAKKQFVGNAGGGSE